MSLVILILGVVIVVLVAVRFMPDKDSKFHPVAASLQALITVFVALVAGYWYFIERKGMPHATIELTAKGVRLDERTALVQARVEIENTGHVVLRPPEWDVRLLAIVPTLGAPVGPAAAHARRGFDRWPEQFGSANGYYNGELRWTPIRRFHGPAILEIEPGERDVKTFDILVSCELRSGRLTAALRKPSLPWWLGGDTGPWWWSDRLMFSLRNVCEGEIGDVRELAPDDSGSEEQGKAEEEAGG
jgi:hypothetical protein